MKRQLASLLLLQNFLSFASCNHSPTGSEVSFSKEEVTSVHSRSSSKSLSKSSSGDFFSESNMRSFRSNLNVLDNLIEEEKFGRVNCEINRDHELRALFGERFTTDYLKILYELKRRKVDFNILDFAYDFAFSEKRVFTTMNVRKGSLKSLGFHATILDGFITFLNKIDDRQVLWKEYAAFRSIDSGCAKFVSDSITSE